MLELNSDGSQKARNVYGTNLIPRTIDGQTVKYLYNGHSDKVNCEAREGALGYVVALVDETGNIVGSYYYDAFGNILEQTGNIDNNVTYAGYQYDEETGLYYLNARMYDPVTARFMQEDSYRGDINDPLSLNLYTYCHNNPVKYVDPTGHFVENQILELGSSGKDVEVLQKKLEKSGYLNMPKGVDYGYFGELTLDAINKYKEDNKLWNTGDYAGKVGITTWDNMGLQVNNPYVSQLINKLQAGSSGENIVELQKSLSNTYDKDGNPYFILPSGATYGYYGTVTEKAVAEYQMGELQLRDAQIASIKTLNNLINDHCKPTDFSGTKADLQGKPIPDGKVGYYNHKAEMDDTLRGLNKVKRSLDGSLKNPKLDSNAKATLQESLDRANYYIEEIDKLYTENSNSGGNNSNDNKRKPGKKSIDEFGNVYEFDKNGNSVLVKKQNNSMYIMPTNPYLPNIPSFSPNSVLSPRFVPVLGL